MGRLLQPRQLWSKLEITDLAMTSRLSHTVLEYIPGFLPYGALGV